MGGLGSASNPDWELTDHLADGEGLDAHFQELHPRFGATGLANQLAPTFTYSPTPLITSVIIMMDFICCRHAQQLHTMNTTQDSTEQELSSC